MGTRQVFMFVMEERATGITRAVGPYTSEELRADIAPYISGLSNSQLVLYWFNQVLDGKRQGCSFSPTERSTWTVIEQSKCQLGLIAGGPPTGRRASFRRRLIFKSVAHFTWRRHSRVPQGAPLCVHAN
jgi:hypothetical protein